MIQADLNGATIELIEGDITKQAVDAIVNAANKSLLGGGGVDGAIHRAAGPDLLEETRTLGGCNVGDAKITKGYKLPARHVIHAVGPVYAPTEEAAEKLASVYRRSLEVAKENHLASVAFPAISTGVYRYPLDEAAAIALRTTYDFLKDETARGTVRLVRIVLFGDKAYQVFRQALHDLAADSPTLHLR